MTNNGTRSAFIVIVGLPNVGKSTLLNQMIGKKVAIVSDKPQTTRNRIMGVLTCKTTQMVFLDTPGAHRPRTRLGKFMAKTISDAVSGVDAAVLVVEPVEVIRQDERNLIKKCEAHKLPVVLVINKIDSLGDKSKLLNIINMWKDQYDFDAIIPVSALTGDGVEALIDELSKYAFDSPHFFPDNAVSDQPDKLVASELIREKVLQFLRDEVPHGVAVVIENMVERNTDTNEILDIDATVYCERESHKGIIIGRRGRMLGQIGKAARQDMELLFLSKVNLQLRVKVRDDWRNRNDYLGGFGYK